MKSPTPPAGWKLHSERSYDKDGRLVSWALWQSTELDYLEGVVETVHVFPSHAQVYIGPNVVQVTSQYGLRLHPGDHVQMHGWRLRVEDESRVSLGSSWIYP